MGHYLLQMKYIRENFIHIPVYVVCFVMFDDLLRLRLCMFLTHPLKMAVLSFSYTIL